MSVPTRRPRGHASSSWPPRPPTPVVAPRDLAASLPVKLTTTPQSTSMTGCWRTFKPASGKRQVEVVELVILVTMTFLGAGAVKGVTGMGLPTVAMGVLGIAMPPAGAAAMLVIPSLVTNVGQLLAGPPIVSTLRRLWKMMIGIVLGTVGGSTLLVHADPMWSGISLGT